MVLAGLAHHFAIEVLVLLPSGAFFEVGDVELPMLVRPIESALQTNFLVVLRDVQEELDDRGAFIREH